MSREISIVTRRRTALSMVALVPTIAVLAAGYPAAGAATSETTTHTSAATLQRNDQHHDDPRDHRPCRGRGEVDSLLTRMTDQEKVGQMFLHLPEEDGAGNPDEAAEEAFVDLKVGASHAVTSIEDPGQMAKFNNQLQRLTHDTRLGIPLLMAGNFETGLPFRVSEGGTQFPQQMGLAATGSMDHVRDMAELSAEEIQRVGFNWTLSPVADVNTNPQNPVIGLRAFSDSADIVSDLTSAQVTSYQSAGVLTSAKHFPGHGDTEVDSHYGLPVVTYGRDVLENVHLKPFETAIDAGVETIMTSHVIVEAIDPDLPATLSQDVMTGLLREDMGFDGVIIADSMRMEALTENWDPDEAALLAVKAGVDVINAKGGIEDLRESYQAVLGALQSGEISEDRINASVRRVLQVKCDFIGLRGDAPQVDEEAAAELRQRPNQPRGDEIAEDSIVVVENDDVLPFEGDTGDTTLVVSGSTELSHLSEAIDRASTGPVHTFERTDNPPTEEVTDVLARAKEADRVVVTTTSSSERLPPGQASMIETLVDDVDVPVATVATGLPYDVTEYTTDVDAHVTSFAAAGGGGGRLAQAPLRATAAVIFGAEPSGTLPIEINGEYPRGHGLTYD